MKSNVVGFQEEHLSKASDELSDVKVQRQEETQSAQERLQQVMAQLWWYACERAVTG